MRQGTLDFVDNALDRSSGTIHARATVPNPDLFLVPGEFARVRVAGRATRTDPDGARPLRWWCSISHSTWS